MKRWTKKEFLIAIKLLNEGKSCEDISIVIGRTKKAIWIKLNKEGYSYAEEKMEIIKCANCNKKITALKVENRKFCSKTCSASYNNKNRNLDYSKTKKAFCKNCNKPLIVNQRASLKNVYCKECRQNAIKIKNYEKRNLKYVKNKGIVTIKRLCSVCKKNQIEGLKRVCKKCKTKYYKYYRVECNFDFVLSDYKNEFNFGLIKKHGWYKAKNRGDNMGGVSRDHIFSVKEGFLIGLNPILLKHPANCNLMTHNDNSKKNTNSELTLKELIKKIEKFEKKHKTKECKKVLKEITKTKKRFNL